MAYAPLPLPSQSSTTPFADSAKDSFMDDFNRPYPELHRGAVPPKRSLIFAAILFVWKTLVLPAMGLAYLAFCYVCHYHIIRIGVIADPMAHLPIIKAGVTSISILFISTSLLPLYSLISDLKSEEFFRVLSNKHAGVPLNTVNSISTPSYGLRDSLNTLYRRHASIYFAGAFFAGFVALATSTLAPAVLSVGTVLFDGDLVALSIGAVQRNSILNMSDFGDPRFSDLTSVALDKGNQAGSVAWAETTLGVNYSFQSPTTDKTTYIIPAPQKLPPSTNARWISDVIAMRPTCEWIAPDFASTGGNFSDFSLNNTVAVNLTSKHMQVKLSVSDFENTGSSLVPMGSGWSAGFGGDGAPGTLIDLDSMDDISNGATVFGLVQCATGCNDIDSAINVTLGSDVHTTRYNGADGKAVDVTFLYCNPNAEIQTRYITNNGKGSLSVGDKASTSQANLHPIETSLLLTYALTNLAESGPELPSNVTGLGHQVQFSMVFGNPSLDSTEILPKPIDGITASYATILQSAAKPFMDGSLASTYVPARITREIAVFSASIPHIIASTVLYVLLTAFVLVCHFRRDVAQFTFFSVAACLARSDIPPLFAELKTSEQSTKRGVLESDGTAMSLKKARVLLEGGDILRLRNDI